MACCKNEKHHIDMDPMTVLTVDAATHDWLAAPNDNGQYAVIRVRVMRCSIRTIEGISLIYEILISTSLLRTEDAMIAQRAQVCTKARKAQPAAQP